MALSEILESQKYGQLRSRECADTRKAGEYEEKQEGEMKQSERLTMCCYGHWSLFLEHYGFQMIRAFRICPL